MIMRIARRPISRTFRVIEIARMLAPDAGQQPVQGLHAVPAVAVGRRAIGLGLAGPAQDGQQETGKNYGKNMGAHGVFVRPGT